MIYTFDTLRITDDTRSIHEADLFLLTQQNQKYFDEQKIPTLTPKELLTKYDLDLKIVGITGTNGKTTTAAAIYSMLSDLGYKSALQGTRGFFVDDELVEPKSLTTPSILTTLYHLYLAKQMGATHFVMEVSSHAIAQNRIESLPFALKVLTNITQDHLDYHKTMQNYAATKSAFFQDEAPKLINKEESLVQFNPKGARSYAIEELATYQVLAYSLEEGISGVLRFGSEMVDFHSPLMGLFNLYNLTAAIGAVHMLTDEDLAKVCQTCENFGGVRGRMQILSYDPLIIVDFAHTPDGMQKVFESFPGKKIVALFGAGGDRDRQKRPLMGNVASRFCTRVYLTSDNPRSEDPEAIIDQIRSGIKTEVPVVVEPDRKKALQKAIDELKEDEMLLVLGKGDEEYMEIGDKKIPFSDSEEIVKILKNKKS